MENLSDLNEISSMNSSPSPNCLDQTVWGMLIIYSLDMNERDVAFTLHNITIIGNEKELQNEREISVILLIYC